MNIPIRITAYKYFETFSPNPLNRITELSSVLYAIMSVRYKTLVRVQRLSNLIIVFVVRTGLEPVPVSIVMCSPITPPDYKAPISYVRLLQIDFIRLFCHSKDNTLVNTFPTLMEASNWIGKSRNVPSDINDVCVGRQATAFGYKWQKSTLI